MRLFTIGSTKTTAEHFFTRLTQAGVKTVVDVRLHNDNQLAGFAKREDLKWFLQAIGAIGYRHLPSLAPDAPLLAAYKSKRVTWAEYERQFLSQLTDRRIERHLERPMFDAACLLCSEPTAEHCHRRIVAEYLQHAWPGTEVVHL